MTKKHEQELRKRYEEEHRYFRREHRCPSCHSVIDAHNQIRWRGWRYGVECDDCR